ncbi:MAG: hypothetical protein HZA93_10695 [Verrucomicrobia bacterium]|nr:hypothetical protein [Verrucomicrobiota bacterium]
MISPDRVPAPAEADPSIAEPPSWIVGVCGVAAVASALFAVLLFLNR